MKILDRKIDWAEDWDNLPTLQVTVDKLPKYEDYRFKHVDGRYWAEQHGVVSFFHHVPSNQEGYGGRVFSGLLENGEPFSCRGPWSSNSMAMNALFPASVEATLYEAEGQFPKLGYGSHLLADLWCEQVKKAGGDFVLISSYGRDDQLDESQASLVLGTVAHDQPIGRYSFAIVWPGMTLPQSQAFKRAKRMLRLAEKCEPAHRDGLQKEFDRLVLEHKLEDWLENPLPD